jgi:hypothetical protein
MVDKEITDKLLKGVYQDMIPVKQTPEELKSRQELLDQRLRTLPIRWFDV